MTLDAAGNGSHPATPPSPRLARALPRPAAAPAPESAPASPAAGDAAGPSPTSELELRVKLAKLEKELAEARRDTLKASIPESALEPLEGTTTIDAAMTVEVEMLAHEAVQYIAAGMAAAIDDAVGTEATIVIYDKETFEAMRLLEAFGVATSLLARSYRADTAPAETLSLEPVTAVAKTALDLVALFRQDTAYFGRKVAIGRDALVARLAAKLGPRRVLVPSLGLSGPAPASPLAGTARIVGQLSALYGAQARARGRVDLEAAKLHALRAALETAEYRKRLQVARLEWLEAERPGLSGDEAVAARAEIEALRTAAIPQAEADVALAALEVERLSAEIDRARASLQTADQAVDALAGALTLSAPGTPSLLSALVSAERLARAVEGRESFVLVPEVVAAGGSFRVRRNLFTSLFWGDLLSYSGGAVVTYLLFNSAHEIVASDTLRYMTGFSKFKKLRPEPSGTNFDVPATE